jgi:hypothetical protein
MESVMSPECAGFVVALCFLGYVLWDIRKKYTFNGSRLLIGIVVCEVLLLLLFFVCISGLAERHVWEVLTLGQVFQSAMISTITGAMLPKLAASVDRSWLLRLVAQYLRMRDKDE